MEVTGVVNQLLVFICDKKKIKKKHYYFIGDVAFTAYHDGGCFTQILE